MSKIYIVLMLILLILEFVNRKLENNIKNSKGIVERDDLLTYLDENDSVDYRFEKHYSCDLNDFYIGIHDKEIYYESDKIIIAHEIGHLKFFKKNKDTLLFKGFLYSKGFFYLLSIFTMLFIALSIFIPFFAYFVKYTLIVLVIVQIIHLVLVSYTEIIANIYVHKNYPLNRESAFFIHLSTLSQLLYWFLFILLSISLYQFLIC